MEQTDPKPGTGAIVVKSTNKTILRVILLLLLLFLGVAGFCYYKFIYLPEKIDREAMRYYPIVNVFLRSSQMAQVDFNKLGSVPYGSELITYEFGPEWSRVKVNASDKEKRLEGYVSSLYLVCKSDFYLLHSIFGDEESKTDVATSKCRTALLNYFKEHRYIGKMSSAALAESGLDIVPDDTNQWQVFTRKEKPNSTYYKKLIDPQSKYTDFAVLIKNINTGERKLLYFYFAEDESPILAMEEAAPVSGYIYKIAYKNGEFTIQYTQ